MEGRFAVGAGVVKCGLKGVERGVIVFGIRVGVEWMVVMKKMGVVVEEWLDLENVFEVREWGWVCVMVGWIKRVVLGERI